VPLEGVKILFVSRDDEPIKGTKQLLDAFALVKQRQTPQLQLVMVGNRSASVARRIAEASDIYSPGFVGPELLPVLYASADIAVVPSRWENFPFAVLEALASSLATIASRVGGIPEQIVDGESGLLVDIVSEGDYRADAPERLTLAILRLANDPDLRVSLGAAARKRVLDSFSEGRLGEDLVRTFLDGQAAHA
jgi:glycosyltransferase involved in cell wall biosynthesis